MTVPKQQWRVEVWAYVDVLDGLDQTEIGDDVVAFLTDACEGTFITGLVINDVELEA